MHGLRICRRVHGDGGDALLAAGALDAQRDLAAVGDQDLAEHYSTTTSASPYSTGWPEVTRMRVTVPARAALIWLKVFIASISSSVCPTATAWPGVTNGAMPGSAER